jgi:hypothetical protein
MKRLAFAAAIEVHVIGQAKPIIFTPNGVKDTFDLHFPIPHQPLTFLVSDFHLLYMISILPIIFNILITPSRL